MTLENLSAEKAKLTPAYENLKPEISGSLIENRNDEMKDSTETERNIAAALAVRFESTLLQIMKRTRNEEGQVNRELNDAVSGLLKELDVSARRGSSDEESYSSPRTASLVKIFTDTANALDRDMGI
jgi:hypothetical protein